MLPSRRHLPPLNALRAFEVSGRRLNFRAAAEELGVTQGAVAQQVRALEEHLDVTLFHRRSRGLSLTPFGTAYLVEVSRAFDTLAQATGQLQRRAEVVTISVTPTVAAKLLIPRLGELREALPGVDLRTVATETLSDFDRDQIDLAVRLSRAPLRSDLEGRILFRQELVAVASPHLVAGMALPLEIAQLRKLPLLHDALDQWPAFLGVGPGLAGPAFNQTTLALDAALAGQGIALACRAFVMADLLSGRLAQVSSKVQLVDPDYMLLRKRSESQRAAVRAVWDWCIQRLPPP